MRIQLAVRLLFAVPLAVLFALCQTTAVAQTDRNLNRLAHPDVALRLGLDDSQIAEVQRLLQQRTEAMLGEDESARPAEIAAIDLKIRGVISDAQWQLWESTPPSNLLEFRFRDQPWGDVLQWFADQDGLTLVMDRTPPGTFTYNDTRQYTSAQAIDLLNSVLLTRGFTLIRRNNLLTLMQVSDSIPIELIPESTLEQLPSRGRFELVRVRFALGKRPVEDVITAVSAYLGNLGRVIPLAQSRQLLVVETAGKMEMINVLINSVPEPPEPPKPVPPEKPPEPVFAAYPLVDLDPQATLEAIRTLIGSERILVDSQTRVLHAYLIPAQQLVVQSAVEKMVGSSVERTPDRSVAYRIGETDPALIESQLAAVAPQAVVSIDTAGQRILVTATDGDHQRIADTLKSLAIADADGEVKVQTFQVEAGQAVTLATAVQAMLPTVKVVGNDLLGTLIARGSDADLRLVDEVVRRWRGDDSGTDKTLHTFALPHVADAEWLALVGRVVPRAQLWLDTSGERLVFLGGDADHRRLAANLEGLQTALKKPVPRSLKAYRVASLAPAQLQTMITPLVDSDAAATITVDPQQGRLLVMANDEVHRRVDELVQQLSVPPTTDRQKVLIVYGLEHADAADVQAVVASVVTEATMVTDTQRKQLIVTATLGDHGKVKAIVDEIDRPSSATGALDLRKYRLESIQAATLMPTLQSLLPRMTLTVEAATNQIIASGTAADHQTLRSTLDRLAESDAGQTRSVKTFSAPAGDFRTLPSVLIQLAPEAVISVDEANRSIIVLGTATQHERIEQAISQLGDSARQRDEILQFQVAPEQIVSMQTAITTLFVGARTAVDPVAGQLTVLAPKSISEQIGLYVRQRLDLGEAAEPQTYQVRENVRATFRSVLSQVLPRATVVESIGTAAATGDRLVVVATASDHARVAELLRQLDEEMGPQETAVVRAYVLQRSDPLALATVLAQRRPAARLLGPAGSSRPVIIDSEEGHVQIEAMVNELEAAFTSDDEKVLRVYPVRDDLAVTASGGVASVVPAATVLPPLGGPRLSVMAKPDEHERLAKWLAKLEADLPQPKPKVSQVYLLNHGDPLAAARLLQALVPTAVVAADAVGRSVAATAFEDDHVRIREMITQFDNKSDEPLQTRVYVLNNANPLSFQRSLSEMFPRATMAADSLSGGMIVAATESQHAEIEQMVQQVNDAPGRAERLKVFKLQHANADQVAESLLQAFGRRTMVGITADSEAGVVFVVGLPDQHQVAGELIQQLDTTKLGRTPRTLRAFSMAGVSGRDIVKSLEQLFADTRPKVDLQYDLFNEQLVAIGDEDQLRLVEETIRQFQPPTRTMEVFSLRANEPSSVRDAVNSLFTEIPYSMTPSVLVDDDRQQVIVRATAEQFVAIRELLGQLGESPEAANGSGPGRFDPATTRFRPTDRMRIIPVGRDSDAILKQLQAVWPTVRDNPLNVIGPATLEKPAVEPPAADSPRGPQADPAPIDPDNGGDGVAKPIANPDEVVSAGAVEDESQTAGIETPMKETAVSLLVNQASTDTDTADETQAAPGPDAAPVIVIAGAENWTIASDDPVALDLLTRWVEAASRAAAIESFDIGRNSSIYVLRHANAAELQTVITNLFRQATTTRVATARDNETRIVADPRINALIVKGSATDRGAIEELLTVLDSPQFIGTFESPPPVYIRVQNTEASRVEQILRTVYESQLSRGGTRPRITIPTGVSEEIASMLDQINAAVSAPILTLSVDDASNAIVMRAPPELAREVQAFIQQIDNQVSDGRTRGVRVVPLTHSSVGQIQQALEAIRATTATRVPQR